MSILIYLAMGQVVGDLHEKTDHREMTVHGTTDAEEMTEMIDAMTEIETETGIETGWTTVMIAAAAREHAVGAEVQFESVIGTGIGFVSGSLWIGIESGTENVIIAISIADESP